ncbi:MAG: hypothetical protein GY715_13760 [Planctomycetes bacterium]|nr:hypothetical protein [Planctomycetota bacterium]
MHTRNTIHPAFGIAPAFAMAIGASALATPGAITALFLEDDPAPGTGQLFQTFDRPNRSASGAVLFTADTNGSTAADDVVYVDSALIAREGDPAPGVVGGLLGPFEFLETAHQINAGGEVVFITTLRDVPSSSERALYRDGTLLAREGDGAAGIPGRSFSDFGFAGITDGGDVGFLADLDGSTGDDSVIYFDGGPLYREGAPVPGLGDVTWDGNFDEIQWNGRGDVLFEGNTSMPSAADVVLFRRMNDPELGVMEGIVAQEGQAIAARTGPDALAGIAQTALASNGVWALRGSLASAPIGADEIILDGAGVVAQQGDVVDELPGVVLGSFGGLAIDAGGRVLYLAALEGATPPDVGEGMFLDGSLVLTDGTQVPGLPEGTLFTDLGFEDLSINDAGEAVFAASYSGTESGDGLFLLVIGDAGCPADLDGSGVVDFGDLLAVIAAWGPCNGPCPQDVTGDGQVGAGDLHAVVAAWGICP